MNDFQQSFADEESNDGFMEPTQGESSVLVDGGVQEDSIPPRECNLGPKEEGNTGSVESDLLGSEKSGPSVYIANLQWWTTDADVERLCSAYGPVVNIQFLAERSNGKSKGVALVEFSDSQAALRCKEGLSGFGIHGKNCVVTFPNQSFQRGYGGRYSYGGYERGRGGEVRGRGRHGRGYGGHGMYDMKPGMHMMGDMPGYMHDMGMMDVNSEMMGGLGASIDGQMMGSHGSNYNMPTGPYPVGGGYMQEEMYEQGPYFRRDKFEKNMEPEEMTQKRQRPS